MNKVKISLFPVPIVQSSRNIGVLFESDLDFN